MFGFHAWDLLIVLLIALVIFGPRKLPEIGGALGKSIREFKRTTNEIAEQIKAPEPKPLSADATRKTIAAEVVEALATPAASAPTPEITNEGE
jgi:sec-independent protein translocase protein TatA